MRKWRRRTKFYLLRLLRQKSGSHSIALGFSVGFIPNLYPTFGIGPFLSVALAKLLRANTISALLGATIGTWLWPVLFYINYKVGETVTDLKVDVDEIVNDSIENVADDVGGIGWNFIVGAGINSVVIGLILYIITFYIMSKYRASILQYIKKVKP
jgi:uncharacterized protein (DUF2062 family)